MCTLTPLIRGPLRGAAEVRYAGYVTILRGSCTAVGTVLGGSGVITVMSQALDLTWRAFCALRGSSDGAVIGLLSVTATIYGYSYVKSCTPTSAHPRCTGPRCPSRGVAIHVYLHVYLVTPTSTVDRSGLLRVPSCIPLRSYVLLQCAIYVLVPYEGQRSRL